MNDCLAIQDKKEETFLYRIFISHPELNASAVARRMGISQSLMSQYISGIKKPSQERVVVPAYSKGFPALASDKS